MEISDLIKILFGAVLGVGLTLIVDWVRLYREKKFLSKSLSAEVSVILEHLRPFATTEAKVFSKTELPSLTPLPVSAIGVMPISISMKVMKAHWAIKLANEHRLLAIEAEKNGQSDALNIYASIYMEWLKKAYGYIQNLAEDLPSC
ncbi:hypothetical protein Q9L42_012965 [Methylomarinum sp. Ch1-1]|uniref:Uncharacterized protein n=1 Tax=Methylomarinum roseum TaxID=3067653 RepID=A0AAU7NQP7_9GAMM|nr:hypothetical protein [Methylomarinum sp. Ch1-1]MDP4520770.1 hypothetical protein [Methylomarinum sp. Ch1-1]